MVKSIKTLNRYRRELETSQQAKTSKSGHAFFITFFRRVRATFMTQRRVENTRVHFCTFSPVSVKLFLNIQLIRRSAATGCDRSTFKTGCDFLIFSTLITSRDFRNESPLTKRIVVVIIWIILIFLVISSLN